MYKEFKDEGDIRDFISTLRPDAVLTGEVANVYMRQSSRGAPETVASFNEVAPAQVLQIWSDAQVDPRRPSLIIYEMKDKRSVEGLSASPVLSAEGLMKAAYAMIDKEESGEGEKGGYRPTPCCCK